MTTRQLLATWLEQLGVTDITPFNDWLASASQLNIDKGDMLVRAGETSNHLYYLHTGLLRLYYTTPDGKERNKAFYGPGHSLGAASAAMTGSAAPFSIQALQPSQLVKVDFDALYSNAHSHPQLSRAVIQLLSGAFIRNEQREAMLLTCNAEQRYQWLCDNEPELLQQLPQFHIASYLGVDAVSLSRLKRKHGK